MHGQPPRTSKVTCDLHEGRAPAEAPPQLCHVLAQQLHHDEELAVLAGARALESAHKLTGLQLLDDLQQSQLLGMAKLPGPVKIHGLEVDAAPAAHTCRSLSWVGSSVRSSTMPCGRHGAALLGTCSKSWSCQWQSSHSVPLAESSPRHRQLLDDLQQCFMLRQQCTSTDGTRSVIVTALSSSSLLETVYSRA